MSIATVCKKQTIAENRQETEKLSDGRSTGICPTDGFFTSYSVKFGV